MNCGLCGRGKGDAAVHTLTYTLTHTHTVYARQQPVTPAATRIAPSYALWKTPTNTCCYVNASFRVFSVFCLLRFVYLSAA